MENPPRAQGTISARELIAILSPTRRPPTYGQVFQSEAEVQRQLEALRRWAERSGRIIDDEWAADLRAGVEGGGEEHFVYFAQGAEFVVKETRPDSWASGATAAQYFARWDDVGKLWPKLEAEVIGISGKSIWTRQKFVDGDNYIDRAEFEADMAKAGWDKTGLNRFRHAATGAEIRDAKPSNVIRGRDGTPWPIDVIVDSTGSIS
ncbi:hypothetical protein [Luteolibacter sp. Populi]|uniref:putative polyvalent protein kinase domain-containing protein n=1 Tax=Luteolibacter sp. Populi TaxID=3230487 RepID=UPI003466D840